MKNKEIRILQAEKPEIRADEEGKKRITGYAVKWEQLSKPIYGYFVEKFARGAFANSLMNIEIDPYADWNHNEDKILGRRSAGTLMLEEDEIGLKYEILPPDWAKGYVESIDRGDVKGSSFIFAVEEERWDKTDPKMPIRTIDKAYLFEVSPVINPAYPQSESNVRSAKEVFEAIPKEKPKDDFDYRQREIEIAETEINA